MLIAEINSVGGRRRIFFKYKEMTSLHAEFDNGVHFPCRKRFLLQDTDF